MADQVRAFISHHNSPWENAYTGLLADDLRAAGVDVWVDMRNPPDDFIARKISEGLTGEQWLILMVTPAALASPWVPREINAALNARYVGRMQGILLFIISYPTDPLPLVLQDLPIFDATIAYESARYRLFRSMGLRVTDAPPAPGVGSVWPSLQNQWEAPRGDSANQATDPDLRDPGRSGNAPGRGSSNRRNDSGGWGANAGELRGSLMAGFPLQGSGWSAGFAGDPAQGSAWPVYGSAFGNDRPKPLPSFQEQVALTSRYPREVTPQVLERLLVFIALNTNEAAAQVEQMAVERLLGQHDEYRAAGAEHLVSLQRRTQLTVTPNLAGFHIDPASITTEWTDDVQCYEFRLRAEDASPGLAVNGRIDIHEGPILRGEIPLSIFVRGTRQPLLVLGHFTSSRVAAYRNTFPSYSRKDEYVVRACESVVHATGDRFLRDVHMLRTGEEWSPALERLIEQADVFQLFWSRNAAESPNVEHEWRHALTFLPHRLNFIRTVYWTPKPYPVPLELKRFQLGRLDPELLGLPHPHGSTGS